MNKDVTQFEHILKQKMTNYEAPYDASSWIGIEKRLGRHAKSYAPWIVALAASLVVTVVFGLVIHNYKHSNSEALAANISSARFESVSTDNIQSIKGILPIKSNLETPELASEVNNSIETVEPKSIDATVRRTDHKLLAVTPEVPIDGTLAEKQENTPIHIPADKNALVFESNVREGCAGVEVNFLTTNGPSSGSYLWNFGDGRYSNETNPKHKYTRPGKYDVSLSVTSNDGQIRTVVLSDMITIFPAPEANFSWEFLSESPDKAKVQINNTSNNANHYSWKFEDGSSTSQVSPIKEIKEDGKYNIALEISNEYGCKDQIVKQIFVNTGFNLGASTSFYPSKEDYMPTGLKGKNANFVMTIYDMGGNKLYQTSSSSKGWTGKLSNGTSVEAGQYQWKVIMIDNKLEKKYFNGVFTVFP